ncbi:MAG: FKBP-type peptidyl-prolyl cis-trans isomerase [Candidatus Pacebacteria bacterium]|nr:FKBP-type peptidyl-prolyl cis-trans isomerase [Candidatus Paceibacterota bacterium]
MDKENNKNMNIVLAVIICLAVVGILVFISIKNKVNMASNNNVTNNQPSGTDNTINIPTTPSTPTPAPTENTTAGDVAKTGDTVSMNYTGKLADGTVFDSNIDPKFGHVQPFVFTLGAGQVIPGWDTGIVGMKIGETKTLVIPPADAYGANGYPPTIPPNATLTFEVTLLAIKK